MQRHAVSFKLSGTAPFPCKPLPQAARYEELFSGKDLSDIRVFRPLGRFLLPPSFPNAGGPKKFPHDRFLIWKGTKKAAAGSRYVVGVACKCPQV
jgi:hypothetical protein